MVRCMIWVALFVWCASCAANPGTTPTGKARMTRLDVAAMTRIPEQAPDSVCREFTALPDLDTHGCMVRGAFPGEIDGEALGDEMSFRAALAACVAAPACTGVSSSWYTGTPWVPMVATKRFQSDGNSYACTVLVGGCR